MKYGITTNGKRFEASQEEGYWGVWDDELPGRFKVCDNKRQAKRIEKDLNEGKISVVSVFGIKLKASNE